MLRGVHLCLLTLSLLTAGAVIAEPPIVVPALHVTQTQPVNWTGDFAPCLKRDELLRYDYMDLGVRISTSNRLLARAFRRAMDFWSSVIDMKWHPDESSSCAVQLVDGNPSILPDAIVARSQFTEWRGFQGWIAFDPHVPMTRTELYVTAVHEMGHMLGLKHNPNARSVMYYLELEGPEVLDPSDLMALSERHRLRVARLDTPIRVCSLPVLPR